MKRNFRYVIFFTLSLLLSASGVFAQREYLVTVNPTTGAITKTDSIPGVRFISGNPAFNETTKEFSFIGTWDSQNAPVYLYTLNSITGDIIYRPLLSGSSMPVHLQYSKATGVLYGVVYDQALDMHNVVVVDKVTGANTFLQSLPGFSVFDITINEASQRMYLTGSAGGFELICLDLATGGIISQMPTQFVWGPVFNNTDGQLYCLSRRPGASPGLFIMSMSTVDPGTGMITVIGDLPDLEGMLAGANQTLNVNEREYYFQGVKRNANGQFIYSVDMNNGAVISTSLYPSSGVLTNDNLIFLRYDNISGKLNSMLWEANTVVEPPSTPTTPTVPVPPAIDVATDSTCILSDLMKIHVNGVSQTLVIDKAPTVCKVTLNLYNMIGQLMLRGVSIADGRTEISLGKLSSGIYYYQMIAGGRVNASGQIFK